MTFPQSIQSRSQVDMMLDLAIDTVRFVALGLVVSIMFFVLCLAPFGGA